MAETPETPGTPESAQPEAAKPTKLEKLDALRKSEPKRRIPRFIVVTMIGGAVCGTLMGIATAVVFKAYKMPAGSMWPTVVARETVLANRYAKPDRAAIVVFRYPEQRTQLFAKRIVGLPGDRISVHKDGELSINGWRVPRCNVGRAWFRSDDPSDTEKHQGMLAVEFLGTATYLVFEDEIVPGTIGEGMEWKVPAGEYFVLGDNRNNSHDSRAWFGGKGGGVPTSDVVGSVYGRTEVRLPKGEGTDGLAPGLATCLSQRPAQTEPPRPQ